MGVGIALVVGMTAMGAGAQLPTGMTAVRFYDTTDVSFVRDSARTVGLWEVPGKPQHFLVLDQRGLIYSLYPDTTLTYAPGAIKKYSKKTLADFKSKTKQNLRSEMGAWSLAFHPNYQQNHYVYVCYFRYLDVSTTYAMTHAANTARSDGYVVVDRYTASADHNVLTRDTTVYSFYHQASYGVTSIGFGLDGLLYIATSVYNQNGWSDTTVARKILRIDINNRDPGKMYSIPPTNPLYASTKANVKKEIYASGLRNVWSMNFDRFTGALWAGDVGQDLYEEINLIKPGKNYGWANGGNSESSNNGVGIQGPCPNGFTYTGSFSENQPYTCATFTKPDWSFSHSTGSALINCIVVGPAFSGDSTSPFYRYHIITDVQRNEFWAMKVGAGDTIAAPIKVGQSPTTIAANNDGHNGIVHIGEDSYGNMYASYVSWYFSGSIGTVGSTSSTNPLTSGQKMFHEIYRLSHPQLTPRTTALTSPVFRAAKNTARMGLLTATGANIFVPDGFSGLALHDLRGRTVWSHRGTGTIRIPDGVAQGVLHARFLP
jgi:hypothetical protein